MVDLDIEHLRQKIDLESKYVDFSLIRTTLTVEKTVKDLDVTLTDPTKEGECRGKCPKCKKDRSFSLNVNTNRFNCFAKGCVLKGGGVIDFISKLYEVPAKEASHLLACAYGISPYSSEEQVISEKPTIQKSPAAKNTKPVRQSREVVRREEFDDLKNRFERLSMIVWSLLFENGEINEDQDLFDESMAREIKIAAPT